MSRLQLFLIRCGIVVAFALGAAYLIKTNDPKQFEREEAYKQETVDAARRQHLARKRMERIATETKTQLAEASK